VVILRKPSARLTHHLKLNSGQRLLRFSVLRETPMTGAIGNPFQKAKMLQDFQVLLRLPPVSEFMSQKWV
jgi:hypothetical protein